MARDWDFGWTFDFFCVAFNVRKRSLELGAPVDEPICSVDEPLVEQSDECFIHGPNIQD